MVLNFLLQILNGYGTGQQRLLLPAGAQEWTAKLAGTN